MNLLWNYLGMDVSTDLPSKSQLLVFICGVNFDFQIAEEFANMHGTVTGNCIFMQVQNTLEDYSFSCNQ